MICEPGVGRFAGRPFALIEAPKTLTRFMATPESLVHPLIKEKSIASDKRETVPCATPRASPGAARDSPSAA